MEAMLYERLTGGSVRCTLCAHYCEIPVGQAGICRVRRNAAGRLETDYEGRIFANRFASAEEKSMYHFQPGARLFSVGTWGCNFRCWWCRNWDLEVGSLHRGSLGARMPSPDGILEQAIAGDARGIVYDNTEPTVFFEVIFETARLAHHSGLWNLIATNGYMSPEMLDVFAPFLDAAVVELKSINPETYRRYIGGELDVVLENLKGMRDRGVWVEVHTRLIPEINDSPEEQETIAGFIVENLGPETPWHVEHFYSSFDSQLYRPKVRPLLEKVVHLAQKAGLEHVYCRTLGAIDTLCPQCGRILIERRQPGTATVDLVAGCCPGCGHKLSGFRSDYEENKAVSGGVYDDQGIV